MTTLSQIDDVIFVLKIWFVSEKVIATTALPKTALNSPDSLDSELTLWSISDKRWFALGFNPGYDWIKNMTAGNTGIVFAQLQIIWWTFANGYRKSYCFEVSFRKFFLQTSIPPLLSILYAKVYHNFPLKVFCLTVPKPYVEESFCSSENFWYRKILWIIGWKEYHDFPSKNFRLIVPKSSYRNPSVSHKIFGIENFMDKRGGGGREYHDFSSIFFVSQYRKVRRGNLRCSRKFRVSKIFMHKRSISRFSVD